MFQKPETHLLSKIRCQGTSDTPYWCVLCVHPDISCRFLYEGISKICRTEAVTK